jgi:hypothetical protein
LNQEHGTILWTNNMKPDRQTGGVPVSHFVAVCVASRVEVAQGANPATVP